MNDDVRNIVLGVLAAGISAALGWVARTYLWKRKLRRKQAFFGLPTNSESLLVVNRDAGSPDLAVHRYDVFALLELSALIKDCGSNAQVITHEAARQGFGERTEFCVGGPGSNRRMAAHMQAMLPGVRVNTDPEPVQDRLAFQVGSERYRMEKGVTEYVLLARLTASTNPACPGPSSCSAASARSPTRRPPATSPATTNGWPASTATTPSSSS